MKHLLKLKDLDKNEILDLLNLADQLKYETKHGIEHHLLKGKTLGMIFQKSSTRTRVSFETGMYQLGGQALFLSSNDRRPGIIPFKPRSSNRQRRARAGHCKGSFPLS